MRSAILLSLLSLMPMRADGPAPQAPPVLTPVQAEGVIRNLAGAVPFMKRDFKPRKLLDALKTNKVQEDARPLLPEEFLAIPEDQRKNALHPDTACLLVLRLWRAAVALQPEAAKTQDWMVPVLARAQPVGPASDSGLRGTGTAKTGMSNVMINSAGKNVGPNCPILEFRRNLPGDDPRVGLDYSTNMVGLDRPARTWIMLHGAGFAPENLYAAGEEAQGELERWLMARVLVARCEAMMDPAEVRAQFLRTAAPQVPEWDAPLAARLKAAEARLGPQGAPR